MFVFGVPMRGHDLSVHVLDADHERRTRGIRIARDARDDLSVFDERNDEVMWPALLLHRFRRRDKQRRDHESEDE